jgi:hypothetical protein
MRFFLSLSNDESQEEIAAFLCSKRREEKNVNDAN